MAKHNSTLYLSKMIIVMAVNNLTDDNFSKYNTALMRNEGFDIALWIPVMCIINIRILYRIVFTLTMLPFVSIILFNNNYKHSHVLIWVKIIFWFFFLLKCHYQVVFAVDSIITKHMDSMLIVTVLDDEWCKLLYVHGKVFNKLIRLLIFSTGYLKF